MGAIRTPDQRLRVFVSSTLRELEPERRAARAAIESLHLAPVMFELGARPHPPRSLYRSYLAQSDVFVGIYGERYGWVAPDEEISGLEDEYRLSGELPRLMYIRDPAPERDARLDELLDRIRADDTASYRAYSTPEELGDLLIGDLATLLAERFDASRAGPGPGERVADQAPPAGIPAPYTRIVGRARERDEVLALLASPGVRLVTLVGPGGIGKSRLAIEVATAAAATGREVAFALLESISSPTLVTTAISRALGVRDNGEGSLAAKIADAVTGRDLLLVVDNMEHVLDAAGDLVQLITQVPDLQVLVTSRSPLRVRAELAYDLGPLATPDAGADEADAAALPAVDLFVQRAMAVRPEFRLTPENAAVVGEICRALDGVPLAIELAAARVRSMAPADILARLGSGLTLLTGGSRDLPARQRTLRDTIRWSVQLLGDADAAAFAALAVSNGPFSLDTAAAVLGDELDAIAAVEALLDASLLRAEDRGEVRVFTMQSLVRQFARELDAPASARDRWVAHYTDLVASAGTGLRGPGQEGWLHRLDAELENVGGVMRHLLDVRELDAAAEYAWSLYIYVWLAGRLGLVRTWMLELLAIAQAESLALQPRTEAIAGYYRFAIGYWLDPTIDVVPGLTRTADLFEQAGDPSACALSKVSIALGLLSQPGGPDIAAARATLESSIDAFRIAGDAWGQAASLITLGRLDLATRENDAALTHFEEALRQARTAGEGLAIVIAQNHRGWARLATGDVAGAEADFLESLAGSRAVGHVEGIAYGLEGRVAIAATRGEARQAGLLLGAARELRRRVGIRAIEAFDYSALPARALRDAGLGDDLDAGVRESAGLSIDEVLRRVG